MTISRAVGSMTFPAEFMLVAAMNPCPCGYHGSTQRRCRCSPLEVQRYRRRISGPLLDRIDLHVEVPATAYKDLAGMANGEPSAAVRERVEAARAVGQRRGRVPNARLGSKALRTVCRLDDTGAEMLRLAMSDLHLSARAHDRILKVARTIADLAGAADIAPDHVGEAVQYRSLDRG